MSRIFQSSALQRTVQRAGGCRRHCNRGSRFAPAIEKGSIGSDLAQNLQICCRRQLSVKRSSSWRAHFRRARSLAAIHSPKMDGSTSPAAAGEETKSAWIGAAGPGSFDLRSDVVTTPTPSMLRAIQSCTLLDDVFCEDPTTRDLESHVATLTGKDAGLFVQSGTMGNILALRTLLVQAPYGILCDQRSHIIKYEAGGVSSVTGATIQSVVPANGVYLTLEDVTATTVLGDDVHACPTKVISLENTLNGIIMPLPEVARISSFARAHGIRMHCDGARLWEAAAAGAGSLSEYAAYFDTLSLCFSKGLGAPVGSIIVGTRDLLKRARWLRKSMGGGMRQPGFIAAAARVAVDETFGKSADGRDGLLKSSHATAKRVEELWTGKGGRLVHPAHTNMCWLDLDAAGCRLEDFIALGAKHGLKLGGGRLVTHYQVAQNRQEVLRRLEAVFHEVFSGSSISAEPGAA